MGTQAQVADDVGLRARSKAFHADMRTVEAARDIVHIIEMDPWVTRAAERIAVLNADPSKINLVHQYFEVLAHLNPSLVPAAAQADYAALEYRA
jgi:hypothetical protein